ncbi:MAG: hypothetical protein Q9178_004830 [Gyalolechia marmorata]
MNLWETPSRADDEIRRITLDLSAKWGLVFPQLGPRSPAKTNFERPEEKVLGRLQYLYFYDQKHNKAATSYAISCFEDLAPKLLAGWIVKTQGDSDVLPTRTRSGAARQNSFLSRKPVLNDEQASDLMQALLRYLTEAMESVMKGVSFEVDHEVLKGKLDASDGPKTPQNKQPKSVRRSSRISAEKAIPNAKPSNQQKDGNIRNYMKPRSNENLQRLGIHTSEFPQSSSDDYKVDDELFNDVEMQDALSKVAPQILQNATSNDESLEEIYQTPPDSPSGSNTMKQRRHSPMGKPVQIHQYRNESTLGQSKKRTYPAPPKPDDVPRKISRDNSNNRSFGFVAPYPRKIPADDKVFGGPLHRSFSSDSFTPTTSSGATLASSAWTTPNTSFMTETPGTSFDSSNEPFELDPTGSMSMQTRRSWQNLKEPFGLGLDMDWDPGVHGSAKAVSMGPPALIPMNRTLPEVSVKKLLSLSPFSKFWYGPPHHALIVEAAARPQKKAVVGLRQLYELCRVSTQTRIPLEAFEYACAQAFDNYETLWSQLAVTAKQHGSLLPERSSSAAWKHSEQGFKGVALTGSLKFLERPSEGVFEFKLNPLRTEPTYRLARKYGQDRFFVLSIPSLELKDLPPHIRSDPNARRSIVDWLVQSEHSFLGRTWRAFYVKPEGNRKAGLSSPITLNESSFRIYLFAESGYDFLVGAKSGEKDPRTLDHAPMELKRMVDWFIPAKVNRNQPALKLFARFAIGLSQTEPTVGFSPWQIIRSDDAHADSPVARRLQHERSQEKKTNQKPDKSNSPVMNDGCARISRAAAKAITEMMHLEYTPSIFQGRIAGAKGVWMIDALEEYSGTSKGGFWIEITDSQLKFESNPRDNLYPDSERVEFEVHSFSKPLREANLNFQLMTILTECKVPSKVFCDLLEADLTAKVAELEAAMESGLAIRKWNQEVNPVNSERISHGVEMQGGMPSTLPEKINWFVEHGFEPHNCCRLKDLLYSAIAGYCVRLESRMNIGVAKSTYAYMIADPLAVLEEGEVHICFSTPFEHEMMLHDIDLLVARLPASLPSDIQKVRAVFKVELKVYRDVIVFSSKGACSLAEKLSGGDYDGDKAWICWEPCVVDPFENAPVAKKSPLDTYGIELEKTTVSDLLTYDDYTDRFLRHGFDFNLQSSLLGICTSYFESLCYQKDDIRNPSATKIAQLLGHLVDRAKAGIIFDDEKWVAFLKREGLPKSLPKPAYKDKGKGVPKSTNLIDRLVFVTAKGVREKALGDFSRRFKTVGTYDADILVLHKNECEEAKRDKGIKKAMTDLKSDLQTIKDFWSTNCMHSEDSGGGAEASGFGSRARRKSVLTFQAIAERVRDDFLALRPSAEARALSPIVERWDRECQYTPSSTSPSSPPPNYWTLLKASTIFFHHHERNFIWYAAGPELGILKSQARGMGTSRTVVSDIWECLKVDGKAVDRKRRKAEEDQGTNMGTPGLEDGFADEYGDWGWMEGAELDE